MMNGFTVFPAIDLRSGKVVRLAQGDPSRQTEYCDDPAAAAQRWLEQGAAWLHVIDLDAALGDSESANQQTEGCNKSTNHRAAGINESANRRVAGISESTNHRALKEILATAARFGARVEFGGGIRSEEQVRRALDLGVERVFLGTAAIRDPGLVDRVLAAHGPGRIAGDIGARDGRVVIRGWQEATPLSVLEAGRRFRRQGLEWCVLTDVSRDGVNAGIEVTSAAQLQKVTGLRVVVSGGVSALEDVRRARAAGLAGVIIGRALYEGKISLREVVTALAIHQSD